MGQDEAFGAAQDDLGAELTQIANQLRALGNNGLRWTDDPYQVERFHAILRLSARLMGLVDVRSAAEIEQIFFEEMHYFTPFAVVDTAVFDDTGRILLIQRADDHLWAMPGGACDVGEAPATAGAREVWEESGYQIEVTDLLGIFDSRYSGTRSSHHLYHLLFTGHVVSGEAATSRETIDVRWFAAEEIPWDALHPGHVLRIRFALNWRSDPQSRPYFDREAWTPGGSEAS